MLIVSRKTGTEFLTVAEFYYKTLCKHRAKINSARISDLHTQEGEE